MELLRQYDELKKKKEDLTAKLESLRERDPETIRIMSRIVRSGGW